MARRTRLSRWAVAALRPRGALAAWDPWRSWKPREASGADEASWTHLSGETWDTGRPGLARHSLVTRQTDRSCHADGTSVTLVTRYTWQAAQARLALGPRDARQTSLAVAPRPPAAPHAASHAHVAPQASRTRFSDLPGLALVPGLTRRALGTRQPREAHGAVGAAHGIHVLRQHALQLLHHGVRSLVVGVDVERDHEHVTGRP